LRPELAALAAGRLFLRELDRLARARQDFAFESTLSGLTYMRRLKRWKAAGWRIEIVYLWISPPRGQDGAQDRAHVWHSRLRLEKRQGGRRKTLTYPAGELISMFPQFRKTWKAPSG